MTRRKGALTPEQQAARRVVARQNVEMLVGAGVLVAFAIFLVYAFTGSAFGARPGYPLVAEFGQVDGLSVGSEVRLAGLSVGRVSKLDLDLQDMRPIVTMIINERIKLPTDSSARVATDSLLGAKFIKLDPGGDEEMIAPGGRIDYVQDAVIVERLLKKIVDDAEARRESRVVSPLPLCPCPADGAGGKTGD